LNSGDECRRYCRWFREVERDWEVLRRCWWTRVSHRVSWCFYRARRRQNHDFTSGVGPDVLAIDWSFHARTAVLLLAGDKEKMRSKT
jgi:hypothetical protein